MVTVEIPDGQIPDQRAAELHPGLTAVEVAARIAAGNTNDVPVRASRSVAQIVRANVLTRFNAIIGVLFAVIVVIGPVVPDGMFGLIIMVNTAIGIVQEVRAKRTLERLAIIGEARPRVRRDGRTIEISANEVVLDDVIELGPGDKVVVDGVVLAADGLEIDESLLTGEADPVDKTVGELVLSGSFVVAGSGLFRASKVGREAYAAQLAEEASRFTLVRSELRNGINRILTFVTFMIIPAGALTIYSQIRLDDADPDDAIRGMVAALVPMVPEGLILLTSVAFAIGVVRLGRRQCLVQELPAIEGLARVSVVCADKTGTLTENRMRLAEIRPVRPPVEAAALTGPAGAADPDISPVDVLRSLAAADPRPNASIAAIADGCGDGETWPATAVAPFSAARKWSGASFTEHGHWVLGAPDVLLPSGHAALVDADDLGSRGLRVLLLARATVPVDGPDAPGEVDGVALVVLEQKIRDDAAETLRYFADQNVELKVISGDNAVAVGAVATTLGLPHADEPVDARTLPEDTGPLAERLARASVFGRVTPAQKREMVKALQSSGHNVAMTGDGVNDVLALKDADIGVAMGSGSPAARAVAQIVLLDNRFATLPQVVGEGRRVIGNIERVSVLFLTKTVYSVLLAIMIGAAQIRFPFLPRHVTLIGWFTIGIPAFFLALAPNTERARAGFVPRVMRRALPAGVTVAVASFVTYLLVRSDGTGTPEQYSTATMVTLVMIALWVLIIVARPYVWWKVALVASMIAGFLLCLLVPAGQRMFEFDTSNSGAMTVAVVSGAVGMAVVELGWRLLGKRRRENTANGAVT